MGEILQDAVTHVITPSLEWFNKTALEHIARFADDYTGNTITNTGQLRQSRIGLITEIPLEKFEYPYWREPDHPLQECIEHLIELGWLKALDGALDGALLMNASRLIRMMDVEETCFAENQHRIIYRTDEDGNEIPPPCEDYVDPLFKPFSHFADQVHPGDFEASILDDVTEQATRLVDTGWELERDHFWVEDRPERWTRAIHNWKDYLVDNNTFRVPEQWQVSANEA